MEHSAILSTFIKLPFVIKIFVLSIFEWLFYTGFTVYFLGYKVQKVNTDLQSAQHHSFVCLFGLRFYFQVNRYGYVEAVSLANHTFFLGKLD